MNWTTYYQQQVRDIKIKISILWYLSEVHLTPWRRLRERSSRGESTRPLSAICIKVV